MKQRWVVVVAITLLAAASEVSFGQRGASTQQAPMTQPMPSPNANRSNFPNTVGGPTGIDPLGDVFGRRLAEDQLRTRNAERQKKIESDTEKLVGLASTLKEKVQEEKEMSPADLSKKAEEIEKLARSVKDKMRG